MFVKILSGETFLKLQFLEMAQDFCFFSAGILSDILNVSPCKIRRLDLMEMYLQLFTKCSVHYP